MACIAACAITASCGDPFNLEPPIAYVEAEFCSTAGIQEHVIDSGPGPNAALGSDGFSAVWIAAAGIGTSGTDLRCVQALTLLIEAGGSVEGNQHGWSILGFAVTGQNQPAVIDFLVAEGAEPCLPIDQHVSLDSPRFDGQIFSTLAEVAQIYGRPPDVVAAFEQAESACSGQ